MLVVTKRDRKMLARLESRAAGQSPNSPYKESPMLKLGQFIVDMHGGNFNTLDRKSVLLQHYEFKCGIEWIDEGNAERISDYLTRICKSVGKLYTNKYLVIVGEATPFSDDDWHVAMYAYDGRRVGVIHIRERI